MTSFVDAAPLRHHFFAVARSADVAPGPVAVVLLGQPVVLFRDADGHVGALPDRCPHREMPLSKGSIGFFGELVCGYHGWAYDAGGTCLRIPSSHATATPSQARLRPFAVRERYGLVWVALDDPVSEPPVVAHDADPSFRRITAPVEQWGCAATRMVDNFCDVAHFPYVHVGTFGAGAAEEVEPVSMEVLEGGFEGYRYEVDVDNPEMAQATTGETAPTLHRRMSTGFALPTTVRSTIAYESGLEHVLLLCTTPVTDTQSLFTFVVWRNDVGDTRPDDEVIAFDRAIGDEDRAALEQIPGTLPLDQTALASVQSDRCGLAWRRRFLALIDETSGHHGHGSVGR